jgi:hypothetical protein
MSTREAIDARIRGLIDQGKVFQKLTAEDIALFGSPDLCFLDSPIPADLQCIEKRARWIEWRGAPYAAQRHSEYLFIPEKDLDGNGPKILLAAVMYPPSDLSDYLDTMPAKRRYTVCGRKAESRGYYAKTIRPSDHAEQIWRIVHSNVERQGRAISPRYAERPADWRFPDYGEFIPAAYCDLCCGVFSRDVELVAYLLGKRVGDHVQYDEIMGHADHLGSDVMYLLHYFFLKICLEQEVVPTCLNYGPWYSGVNPFSSKGGLNDWKRRMGFRPAYLILASS